MRKKTKENSNFKIWKKVKKDLFDTDFYEKIKSHLNYRDVKGYISLKHLVSDMSLHLYLVCKSKQSISDYFQGLFIHSLDTIYSELIPCYWVKEDLIKALINTDLPKHWIDLKPFVPKGIFMLPKRLIKNPDGLSLNWLYFEYIKAGYKTPPRANSKHLNLTVAAPRADTIVWTTKLRDDSVYASNMLLEADDLGNPKFAELEFSQTLLDCGDSNLGGEEKNFVSSIEKLCFQLMLYMMAKPDSICVQSGFGSTKAGKTKNARLRDPVWIGKDFKIKRETNSQSTKNPGSGSSKITHWRRGHWRNQKIGERSNPDYRQIWIEPVLVNS